MNPIQEKFPTDRYYNFFKSQLLIARDEQSSCSSSCTLKNELLNKISEVVRQQMKELLSYGVHRLEEKETFRLLSGCVEATAVLCAEINEGKLSQEREKGVRKECQKSFQNSISAFITCPYMENQKAELWFDDWLMEQIHMATYIMRYNKDAEACDLPKECIDDVEKGYPLDPDCYKKLMDEEHITLFLSWMECIVREYLKNDSSISLKVSEFLLFEWISRQMHEALVEGCENYLRQKEKVLGQGQELRQLNWLIERIKNIGFRAVCPKERKDTNLAIKRSLEDGLKELILSNSMLDENKWERIPPMEKSCLKEHYANCIEMMYRELEMDGSRESFENKIREYCIEYKRSKQKEKEEIAVKKRATIQLKKAVKEELKAMDFTVGITIDTKALTEEKGKQRQSSSHSTKRKKSSNSKIKQQLPQIKGAVDDITREHNSQVMRRLFMDMENDAEISDEIREAFESQWMLPHGGAFGQALKSGQQAIGKNHQAKIIASACRLSKFFNGKDFQMENVKAEMLKDLKKGEIVMSENVLRRRYPGFFGFLVSKIQNVFNEPEKQEQVANDYERMVQDVMITQEIDKLRQRPDQLHASAVEQDFLKYLPPSKNGPEDARRKNEAEIRVLEQLFRGKGMESSTIQGLKAQIEFVKLKGRLEASGVDPKHVEAMATLVTAYNKKRKEALEALQPYKETLDVPITFPPQAKQQLMEQKALSMDSEVDRRIRRKIRLHTNSSASFAQWLDSFSPGQLEAEMETSLGPLLKDIRSGEMNLRYENNLSKEKDFYKKWHPYFVGEMIQGLLDKNEALGDGVCMGNASRRAVIDQRNPDCLARDLATMKVLSISLSDRVRQCFHSVGISFKSFWGKKSSQDIEVDAKFPRNLLNSLGVDSVTRLKELTPKRANQFSSKEELKLVPGQLTELAKKGESLDSSNGVAHVSLSFVGGGGHALYIRMDSKREVYRLGDPNIALAEFPDKETFYDFLGDLVVNFYCGEVTKITLFRYNLPKK